MKTLDRYAVWVVTIAFFPLLAACGEDEAAEGEAEAESEGEGEPLTAPELGTGDHTASSVTFTEIANSDNGLDEPRDLAFNTTLRPDELWVVNADDNSAVIVFDASTDERTTEYRYDYAAPHFMDVPTGIAFGQDFTTEAVGVPGTFATCGESTNGGNDFMGPVLWSSDLSVFAMMDSPDPDINLGSHLDMLHEAPLCMGIAHERENIYWTFSGRWDDGAIVKFDFVEDNGIGNDDHSDGEAYRYVEDEVSYVEGVPSHVFYDDTDAMLYIADTGNSRIAKLDTTTGEEGNDLTSAEGIFHVRMDDAVITDVVASDTNLLEAPSGLELHNGLIYVSDNANGRFSAFDLEGTQINYLESELPEGSLGGMAFGPDGKLYFVDMAEDLVLRIDPK